MEYIRTKDGVYKGNEDWYRQCYCLETIINQADTIEKLCDEFVFDMGRTKTIFCSLPSSLKRNKKQRDVYDNIYGAIWTDKGLIYVAKMNDEGELELL